MSRIKNTIREDEWSMETINCKAYRGYICERTIDGKWKVEDHYGKPVSTFRECKDIIRKKLEFLNHHEKQIVYLSKGWFSNKNAEIDNLKVIVADLCDISVEQTELYSVYYWIVELFLKLQSKKYVVQMDSFLREMFTYETPKIDREILIRKMMSQISNVKVKGLNLGEPDYTLLPKYEREKVEV